MLPLDKDLQQQKHTIEEFYEISLRVKSHLENVLTNSIKKNGYIISSSDVAGSKKFIRPINENLYILNPDLFSQSYKLFKSTIEKIKLRNENISEEEKENINAFIYTIQQTIGAGLDLMVDPNSARKHVGNRFEELISLVFSLLEISNQKVVLSIPYETDDGNKIYKCENDLILSPYKISRSTNKNIDKDEIVVSIKTTSKDRMGKIFIDKLLLEKFVGHNQKVIGIFNNDVQRKNDDNISYTLVSGLFMVYTKFLTKIEGVYYLDIPPIALKSPYNQYIKPFSELITKDIFDLLHS